MKTVEEIVTEFRRRQLERGPLFERCRIISQHYNNEMVLPIPEVEKTEAPVVANLLAQGVDQHANRVASYLPDVQAPPLKPGDKASERRADQRRRAAVGFMETNNYDLLMRRRARWLGAFSEAPVRWYADQKARRPRAMIHTPLEVYPCAMETGQLQPEDCIVANARTVAWVKRNYPDVPVQTIRAAAGKHQSPQGLTDNDLVEVVQWLDGEETVVVLYGPGEPHDMVYEAEYGLRGARIINLTPPGNGSKAWGTEILRVPNRLGECPILVPGRITLDVPKGQFDDMPGLAVMQAKLAAMEVNAIANSIWPDQWVVGVDGRNPQIVTAADGRAGIVGQINDGQIITTQMQPGAQTPMAIDRLERAQRLNGGIPSDFGGESASNIRTGRRGDAVLSAAVDYTIQEHQTILAHSCEMELQLAANIDLTFFRGEKKSFYISWKGGKGRLDYTPKDIWTEDRTLRVSYAKPGADINSLNVQIGQLTSIGLLSKLSAGRMHPDVKDPEFEHDQTIYEQLEAAGLAATQQQAAGGALPLPDLARIAELVRSDKMEFFEAVQQVQKEAQDRQSSTVAPAEPGSPEAQPGIAAPGAGAEAGGPIQPPAPSMENLTSILRTLQTQNRVATAG